MKDSIAKIRPYLVPIIIGILVVLAIFIPSKIDQQDAAKQLQQQIEKQTILFQHFLKNETEKNKFIAQPSKHNFELFDNQIALFLYKNEKLIAYSDNQAIPTERPDFYKDGSTIVRLKNGFYHLMKATDKNNHNWIALALLRHDYSFQNNFLKNGYGEKYSIPDEYKIDIAEVKGGEKIIDANGNTLAWLYTDATSGSKKANSFIVFLNILLLLFIIYYLYNNSISIAHKRNRMLGLFVFLGSMLLLRIAMIQWGYRSVFASLDLFDPTYYASNYFSKSLGDLMISIFFLSIATLFYFQIDPQMTLNFFPYKNKKVEQFILFFLIAFTNYVILLVFKSLILDSSISFEVYDILSISSYSIIGLLCLALLLAVHFIFNAAIYKRLSFLHTNIYLLVIVVCILFAIIDFFYHSEIPLQVVIYMLIWITVFSLISIHYLDYKNNSGNFTKIIVYIFLYSNISMFMIEKLYEDKERNQRILFAEKLVTGNDYIAEFSFRDVADRIGQDKFLQEYLTNPLISKSSLKDRLNSIYFSGYFSKYEVDIFAFDSLYNAIKSTDTISYSIQKKLLGFKSQDTLLNSFFFVNDSLNNYVYLAEFDIKNDSDKIGKLLFYLKPKVYNGQSVYPELLLGADIVNLSNKQNYSYAIYVNENLIIQSGDFPYPYYLDKKIELPEMGNNSFYESLQWEHLIKNVSKNKKVIVSVKQEGFFEPVATISYFFVFYLLIFLVILGLYNLYVYIKNKEHFRHILTLTFQSKINLAMLAIIILSFIIIGFVTLRFYHTQYDEYYTERLVKKQKNIQISLANFLIEEDKIKTTIGKAELNEVLGIEIAKLSEANSIDINIFDTAGVLMVSSQPSIFDYGLVSKLIHPAAYFALKNQNETQFSQQENIGDLNYLSTYAPIKNTSGNAIAYLCVPYFAKSATLKNEVSLFLVNLMNAYVFLLICAAILAYLIANSITRPLRFISEKLRMLNLYKKNEHIEWHSKDEIGVLIAEYNKMITELENSAQKLAKNERESAWREMARQIAHEIKNPLTPMKLSIQYLQRAIDEDNPNVRELAQKVNKTLIEQIENLSSIATAFSSFAQMPKGQNEAVDLNDLIKGVIDLFSKDTDCDIQLFTYKENAIVFADKNQIISVFNNLLKNAIQAIPEDRKGEVIIITLEEYGMIKTVVMDNGVGIAPDAYEKVFVPNFTTKSSGTGLGLAIVKQIIVNAGGEIWFESVENESTSFYITLPYYDKQP